MEEGAWRAMQRDGGNCVVPPIELVGEMHAFQTQREVGCEAHGGRWLVGMWWWSDYIRA